MCIEATNKRRSDFVRSFTILLFSLVIYIKRVYVGIVSICTSLYIKRRKKNQNFIQKIHVSILKPFSYDIEQHEERRKKMSQFELCVCTRINYVIEIAIEMHFYREQGCRIVDDLKSMLIDAADV